MTTIRERLQLLITQKGPSKNAFAKQIGKKPQAIGNYTHERDPDYETLAAILETFKDINPEWLLLGKGEMFRAASETNSLLLRDSGQVYKRKATPSLNTSREIRDRIRKLLDTNQISLQEFCRNTLLPAETVVPQIEGDAPLMLEVIEAVCHTIPETSLFWLITGTKEKKETELLDNLTKEIKKVHKEIASVRKEISELKNTQEY